MKYQINKKTKEIEGIGFFSGKETEDYLFIEASDDSLNLEKFKYLYDFLDQKVKIKLYTPDQLEQLRNEWVRSAIEKLYPSDIQLKINTENMESMSAGKGVTEAFIQMQKNRNSIKAESHTIDFQIKNE